MTKLKQIIEITVGVIFIILAIIFFLNLWVFNPPGSWTTPEDETPIYPEQSIF